LGTKHPEWKAVNISVKIGRNNSAFTEVGDMKFVVIGGDAAGMSAASRAKRKKHDLEVTVLEQTGDVSYSA
jgi:ribulose 1,5-bisphosphate synthetase/thiazole synthase